MNYIVLDLEATCWEGFQQRNMSEIVEIGAVKVNHFGEEIGKFHSFVKPVFHPHLSSYFLRLTGIPRLSILNAKTFDVVFPEFMSWVLEEGEEYYLCAWGSGDLRFLQENTKAHRLSYQLADRYIDVKLYYNTQIKWNRRKPFGLLKALHHEGFEFEGSQHRAFDDAYNLCKLFVKYIDDWQR